MSHLFCLLLAWYYFGVVGSFIFIIIQLILLIDFAHSWNQSWVQRAEEGNTKCWFAGKQSTHPLKNVEMVKREFLKVTHILHLLLPLISSF